MKSENCKIPANFGIQFKTFRWFIILGLSGFVTSCNKIFRFLYLDINGCDLHMLKHECEFYAVQPLIRRLQLCEDLEHSQCGDVLFNGYINPPHSNNVSLPFESTQLPPPPLPPPPPPQSIVYQPLISQSTNLVRPGTALRLNNMMQQTLNRSASQIGDFR